MSSFSTGNIVIRATISCVGGMGMFHLHQANSHKMAFNFFFLKKKKNALRDFAAFHFMSTNKRTKKPFWREKWGVSEKRAP